MILYPPETSSLIMYVRLISSRSSLYIKQCAHHPYRMFLSHNCGYHFYRNGQPTISMSLFRPQVLHLYDNKPVYRLPQQSIRRLAFVPPYSVFCSISFRCGGLSIEHNQEPLAPEVTLTVTHHDRQKQVEVKRSSRANPHEIRLFTGCPYYFTLPVRI